MPDSPLRRRLADALLAAGPDAPTLCEGWRTRHLAAHLVHREQEAWRAAGVAVPPLAGWTESQVQSAGDAASGLGDYTALVERFADGPPWWSPFRWLPQANVLEFAVHTEDVMRGGAIERGPAPDSDAFGEESASALFASVRQVGRLAYRSSPVGVVLRVPGGSRAVVRKRSSSVVLVGEPIELALHACGRVEAADVEVGGAAHAVAAFLASEVGGAAPVQ